MTERDNWEIAFETHLDRYKSVDPEEASRRTGFEFDFELSRFTLNLLGHRLYAKWPEFNLVPAEPESCPKTLYGFQMQVLAMRALYAGVFAPSDGVFKAYRELPWGELYDANFNGRCIKRFAYGFGFKPDIFKKAAELLSGESINLGDMAFDLPFLGGTTSRFILWKPDDEFPPSAQILFTKNSALMFNAEDLAVVGDVIISALKEVS